MQTHESKVIRRMVRIALTKGLTVSVWDGGEWTLKRSKSVTRVLSACGTTDHDVLRFRDKDGTKVGSVSLVYGNGPGEVVSDYSDVPAMEWMVDVMEYCDKVAAQ